MAQRYCNRCGEMVEDIVLEDSGQMLSRTYIADLEEDELVRLVLDYWGLGEEDWNVYQSIY